MWRKLLLLSCLALAMSGRQVINATSGPWTAQLTGPWRWHAGDNLQWASPSLDESSWKELSVPGPPPAISGAYWIRLDIETGAMANPGLLLGPIAYNYEVYWDGHRIGVLGRLPPHEKWLTPRWEVFHIPPATATIARHVLAIRIGPRANSFAARAPRLSPADNRVGDVRALREAEASLHGADFRPRVLSLLIEFAILLAGVYFLLLQPSVSEGGALRWLGLLLISRALAVLCDFVGNDVPLPISYELLLRLVVLLDVAYVIVTIQFAYAVFRRRIPALVLCLEVVMAALAVFYSPIHHRWGSGQWVWFLLANILIVAVAGRELQRRTPGAKVTFVLLLILGVVDGMFTLATGFRIPINTTLSFGEFRVWDIDFVLLLWLPAMAGQTYKTNQRLRDERERLRGEMDAARHVQEMLLPSRNITIPGFGIEAAYRPATEVGGDFFQVFPTDNGFMLVVGDVSGKGMKAALLVSLIVGALQNRKSDQPARVLADLNAVLMGRSEGGFTTCCCALFTQGQELLLANAGHLPPYRNGTEIETPPGLPLGIVQDAHWTEIRFKLQLGDRFVWLSDGVVEARNGHRDVLGFSRIQQLINTSAAEIARAAQKFGQEDDITVIAVTRP